MKRCPTCNRTFDEDWLAFCTDDGTTLVEERAPSRSEPPPTMMSTPMPPSVSPTEEPTLNLSNAPSQPSYNAPVSYSPPQPVSGWQPPPPPSYANRQQQGLAIASLILGIFSVTIGLCYVGIITGPVAVALGIASLMQIKKRPEQYGGKGMAIAGTVTGAIAFVGMVLFFIFVVIIAATNPH